MNYENIASEVLAIVFRNIIYGVVPTVTGEELAADLMEDAAAVLVDWRREGRLTLDQMVEVCQVLGEFFALD